jgi:CHAD domain-containing protein
MAHACFIYPLPQQLHLDDLKNHLRTLMGLHEKAPVALNRSFYDTFDWRVFLSGGVLEAESHPDGTTLVWRSATNGVVYGSIVQAGAPRFVWDLPSSALRERLTPILEMRALLPKARIETTRHDLRLLNKDEKTVARLTMDQDLLRGRHGRAPRRLGARLRLLPVRGYDKPLQRIRELLENELGLAPMGRDDTLLKALDATGQRPGDYSSKLRLKLDGEMTAAAATQLTLRQLLETLEKNEDGVRADLDSEFLHDFRVAVRRARSALSQIKGVVPDAALDKLRPELGWLGQVTGPTRDLDVYLLKLPGYRDRLPAEVRTDLEPLHDFLVEHQKSEQQRLSKALASPRYRNLKRLWRDVLDTLSTPSPDAVNANRPISEVANNRIWRVYRRVIKEGSAIGSGSPAEALHELRKTCKKLRYLMEFFQSLYPPARIKSLIGALKILQENLGDFQDLEVQAQNLKNFSRQLMEAHSAPAETLMAMGILVADLTERQHQAREAFSARFSEFNRPDHHDLFKALFAAQSLEADHAQ